MAEKTTANIGFEKQIWDAACVLRGNIDASEYKNERKYKNGNRLYLHFYKSLI